MSKFFMECGVYAWPLLALTITLIFLSLWRIYCTFLKKGAPGTGHHAILFWGAISAILGILGQCQGLYNAMGAIMRAREVSPNIMAQGYRESLGTTLWGLHLLFFSAIIWFVLQNHEERRRRKLEI
ncbi:MAG: MotA/TolQ/ExbB proton channel family protein [Candidatus Eisenbacteria bacterium]|uniref:MotA/TolQ/ExbB proton channel family protein n=1 Tax=Eiseniibacteriota bacterium TaxID=2212470 RepID=A0A948W3G2_UNCEI|nr:MotA/TolQ/ExbB proton channel family protein [Candidatus Eisenbacteria bacterium]MBU1948553.1 MotA/TolQ/ExbB proton channel family protein [Candidatus Eisenbacteria bacterium]MBU2691057.1 MotA/TolQ/ExbB proton channel family protein [Candidatus Eisenbacteria bacterium]